MAIIDTIFPATTTDSEGIVVVGAASPHAALADNSDSSYLYATFDPEVGNDSSAEGAFGSNADRSGMRRHRARVIARIKRIDGAGFIYRDSLLISSAYSTSDAGSFTTRTGEWGFVPAEQATGDYSFKWGAWLWFPSGSEISRLFAEIDWRERPTLFGSIRDRAQNVIANGGTITDTRHPRLVLSPISRDGLNTNGWKLWVTDDNDGGATVWELDNTTDARTSFTQAVLAGLPNGDYTAHAIVRSIIGASTVWESGEWTSKFTIDADLEPSFTADALDATGTSKASETIDNTNRPRIVFKDLDLKGLDIHSWSVDIDGPTPSFHSGEEFPDTLILDQLVNGQYTATLTVNTTELGGSIDETSTDTVTFTVDYDVPNPSTPTPLLVTEIKFHVTALPRRRGEML